MSMTATRSAEAMTPSRSSVDFHAGTTVGTAPAITIGWCERLTTTPPAPAPAAFSISRARTKSSEKASGRSRFGWITVSVPPDVQKPRCFSYSARRPPR